MAKRTTPPEEIERMLERMHNFHSKDIHDKSSFKLAFSKEVDLSDNELTEGQKWFRNQIFSAYKTIYPEGLEEQKEIKEFKEPTAEKKEKPKRVFDTPARVKGQIVRSEKIYVIVHRKRLVRFRDRKGRFASTRLQKK